MTNAIRQFFLELLAHFSCAFGNASTLGTANCRADWPREGVLGFQIRQWLLHVRYGRQPHRDWGGTIGMANRTTGDGSMKKANRPTHCRLHKFRGSSAVGPARRC